MPGSRSEARRDEQEWKTVFRHCGIDQVWIERTGSSIFAFLPQEIGAVLVHPEVPETSTYVATVDRPKVDQEKIHTKKRDNRQNCDNIKVFDLLQNNNQEQDNPF